MTLFRAGLLAITLAGCRREAPREARQIVAPGPSQDTPAVSAPPPPSATLRPAHACIEVAKLSPYRYDPSATLLADGRVLLAGGRQNDDSGYLRDAVILDPKTRALRKAASMHEPRGLHGAARLPDGRVLVAGGRTKGVEVYDPARDHWTVVGALGQSVWHPVVATLPSGRLLVAGGDMLWKGAWLDESWLFDGVTSRMLAAPKNALGTWPRVSFVAPDGGLVMAAAGWEQGGDTPCELVFREGSGFSAPPSEDARAAALCHVNPGATSILLRADDQQMLLAGETGILRWDSVTRAWREVARYQTRHIPGATMLADGKTALVAGGLDEAGNGIELCTVDD